MCNSKQQLLLFPVLLPWSLKNIIMMFPTGVSASRSGLVAVGLIIMTEEDLFQLSHRFIKNTAAGHNFQQSLKSSTLKAMNVKEHFQAYGTFST